MPIIANSIVHLEGQGGRLFIPWNSQVGRDQNWKHVHESKVPHLSTKG